MRIAVMGAGAVGCYFGALLHRAGHEVVLIGREGLVEAVRARGLRLQAQDFDGWLPLAADTSPSAVSHAGLVLFCVKSGDTESAGAAMAPFLAPDCIVLNMQNGVDNAVRPVEVLQARDGAGGRVCRCRHGGAGPRGALRPLRAGARTHGRQRSSRPAAERRGHTHHGYNRWSTTHSGPSLRSTVPTTRCRH